LSAERPLYGLGEIAEVVEMLRYRSLDVRSVTLSLDSRGCGSPEPGDIASCLEALVEEHGRRLRDAVDHVAGELGVPVTTVRVAVSPLELLVAPVAARGHSKAVEAVVEAARALDRAAARSGVDYVGGLGAFAERGLGLADAAVVDALPDALAETGRLMGFVNAGSTLLGLSLDAVRVSVAAVLEAASRLRSPLPGARFLVSANVAPDIPFLPAAHHGLGEPDAVINVAISGPRVVAEALRGLPERLPLQDLAVELRRIGFKVSRLGQLVAEKVAKETGYALGSVDLSLAPSPEPGDSIAAVLEAIGVEAGAPGSVAALALLIYSLKRGGAMGVCCAGGYSGAMIPLSEDSGLADAAARGLLTVYKLLAMTTVCSTGIDMVPVPLEAGEERLSGLVLDALAVGVVQEKTLGVRLLPAPGAKPGDRVRLGGLLGEAPVLDPGPGRNSGLIRRGGFIPAPLRRLLRG
jgi:uncharacterized protein (UPF0210 family)